MPSQASVQGAGQQPSSSQLELAWRSVPDRSLSHSSPRNERTTNLSSPNSRPAPALHVPRPVSPAQQLLPLGGKAPSPHRAPFADGWGTNAYISSWNDVAAAPLQVTPTTRRATLSTPQHSSKPSMPPSPLSGGQVQGQRLEPLHRPSTGESMLLLQAPTEQRGLSPSSPRIRTATAAKSPKRVDIQSISIMPYDSKQFGSDRSNSSAKAWRNSASLTYVRRGGRPPRGNDGAKTTHSPHTVADAAATDVESSPAAATASSAVVQSGCVRPTIEGGNEIRLDGVAACNVPEVPTRSAPPSSPTGGAALPQLNEPAKLTQAQQVTTHVTPPVPPLAAFPPEPVWKSRFR